MGVKVDMSSVLDFIKASKEPVNKTQILEATGYAGDFKYCMKTLKERYEELETVGQRANAAYIWKPSKQIYSEMRNSEGYSDSTAGRAIANVMKETKKTQNTANNGRWPMPQQFGEVWAVSEPNENQEGVLIISAKGGIALCYSVFKTRKRFMDPKYIVSWNDAKGWHYICTLNIVNIVESKILNKLYTIGAEEMKAVRQNVAEVLGTNIFNTVEIVKEVEKPVEVVREVEKIVEVEKPVEVVKEVEKIVEVPVEKIVEKPTDPLEIEIAVLKAKNEIYEMLIFGKNVRKNYNLYNEQEKNILVSKGEQNETF